MLGAGLKKFVAVSQLDGVMITGFRYPVWSVAPPPTATWSPPLAPHLSPKTPAGANTFGFAFKFCPTGFCWRTAPRNEGTCTGVVIPGPVGVVTVRLS